ncbi:MAG: type II secretion system F family protein [Candidatus Aenigmarchaeota archaeon]|nr:type II secretion system F family protein [Candidatus Aenigmarchaeota archaeon]
MAYRDYVREKLSKTSLDMSVDAWQKLQVRASLPLATALAVSVYFFTHSIAITVAAWALSFVSIFAVFVAILDYLGYAKAREVEDMLPEALELLSSNLKAGLPLKESLQMLMSEEFGQLGVEMSSAATEMSTGTPIVEALKSTRFHVASELYGKTIETLSRSVESGVNMDRICGELARNINDLHNIRRDIRASTVTYTLFLSFAALIASPILFALSTFLTEASTQIFSAASETTGGGGAPLGLLSFSTTLPPIDLLRNFFLVAIAITSIFTSLGVGIVREGSVRVGLRYMPIFLIVSFVVYFIAKSAVTSIVGLSI